VINVLEVAPGAKWFFLRYKREGNKLRLNVAQETEIKGGYEAARWTTCARVRAATTCSSRSPSARGPSERPSAVAGRQAGGHSSTSG
jgi:hypothetical protein